MDTKIKQEIKPTIKQESMPAFKAPPNPKKRPKSSTTKPKAKTKAKKKSVLDQEDKLTIEIEIKDDRSGLAELKYKKQDPQILDLILEYLENIDTNVKLKDIREHILKVCHEDILERKSLLEGLQNNPKILVEDDYYSFKSKYDFRTIDELVDNINKSKKPKTSSDIIEVKKISESELEEKVKNGDLICITTSKKKDGNIYFPSYKNYNLFDDDPKAKQDLRILWNETSNDGLKQEIAVEELLNKSKLYVHAKKIDDSFKNPKKDKKKKRSTKKLNNQHVGEGYFDKIDN